MRPDFSFMLVPFSVCGSVNNVEKAAKAKHVRFLISGWSKATKVQSSFALRYGQNVKDDR